MWQGVGHVAEVGVYDRGPGLWHGWGHVVGMGTCGRVWRHVEDVVAYGRVVLGSGACGRSRGMW